MLKSLPVLLAVASKDAISINLHFGHTKAFLVYKVDAESCEFVQRREVEHYCQGHVGNMSALDKILSTIDDCSAVFTAKTGEGPAERLSRIGVQSVSEYAYEAIEGALMDFVKKGGINLGFE